MSNKKNEQSPVNKPGFEGKMAPRWLSGGRSDVLVKDNPSAIAYFTFLEELSSLFLREHRKQVKEDGEQ